MVLTLGGSDNLANGFIIKPNQAMSWKSLLLLYFVMIGFATIISAVFFFKGMTLILPFYGLELGALGYALYISAWRSDIKEVVTINDDSIVVEIGRKGPESRHVFQRAWCELKLERPRYYWYPSRLMLRAHGKALEIGSSLNEQERQGLAYQLRKALTINYKFNESV